MNLQNNHMIYGRSKSLMLAKVEHRDVLDNKLKSYLENWKKFPCFSNKFNIFCQW